LGNVSTDGTTLSNDTDITNSAIYNMNTGILNSIVVDTTVANAAITNPIFVDSTVIEPISIEVQTEQQTEEQSIIELPQNNVI